MSAEQILITHQGYTAEAYSTCGDHGCTVAVLEAIGVPPTDAADPENVSDLDIGDDTQITCALLRETDGDEWCAACGDFIRHGLNCGCRDTEQPRAGLGRSHVNLEDSERMKKFWA